MAQLTIKMISGICGIKPHTLRAWEKRYQALTPKRTDGGQRYYSTEDLERLKLLVRLVNQGHGISKVAQLSNEEMRSLLQVVHQEVGQRVSPQETKIPKSSYYVEQVLGHLQEYRLDRLAQELDFARLEYSSSHFVLKILVPLFNEVGMMVANFKLSISQEHALSAIVRDQLAQLIFPPQEHDVLKKVALAAPEKDHHEMGILLASVLCRQARWSTHYFGCNLPAEALAEAVNALNIYYIVLGATESDSFSKQHLDNFLNKLESHLNRPCEVLFGGIESYKFDSLGKLKFVNFSSLAELNSFLTTRGN